MTATRADVLACLRNIRSEIDAVAAQMTEADWAEETYEEGWTARDLLSHIASTSGPANFLLLMASAGARPPVNYDGDAFNRDQVAIRRDRTVDEVLDEIRANIQRDMQAVEDASDALLQQHFVAPWGAEGTVAEVIINSANGHVGGHVADLRAAAIS